MAAPSLANPRAKLDRADEHLRCLVTEARSFLEHNVDTVLDGDPNTGWYTVKLTIAQDPPLRYGVIVGDIAHSLRSALDHLVWQLVRVHGGKPGRWNQFPITYGEAEFLRQAIAPREGKGGLHGLDWRGKAVAMIDGLQPYESRGVPKRLNPFAVLNALSNVDKHRVVHAAYVAPSGFIPELAIQINLPRCGTIAERKDSLVSRQRVVSGTEITRFRVEPPNAHVEVDCDISFDISFEAEGSKFPLVQLVVIAERIRTHIEAFDRFFN